MTFIVFSQYPWLRNFFYKETHVLSLWSICFFTIVVWTNCYSFYICGLRSVQLLYNWKKVISNLLQFKITSWVSKHELGCIGCVRDCWAIQNYVLFWEASQNVQTDFASVTKFFVRVLKGILKCGSGARSRDSSEIASKIWLTSLAAVRVSSDNRFSHRLLQCHITLLKPCAHTL